MSIRSLLVLLFTLCQLQNGSAEGETSALSRGRPHGKTSGPVGDERDRRFHTYVTRPDIRAVRWNMKVHDPEAVAPGYWFVAPYARLKQTDYKKWNGPHIYDGNGELVWSGAPIFHHYNMFDFRLAQVNGEDKMTVIYEKDAKGVILDSTYEVNQTVDMFGLTLPQWLMDQIGHARLTNMHDFNVIDDGKTALMLTKVYENATREESLTIGFHGECTAKWQGFKEVDVATSKVLFEWNSHGHIDLKESTFKKTSIRKMCHGNAGPGGWDILHLNSVDKFPDGDYLISSRHTDALYKISHKDGSIVWRLGGNRSDFKLADKNAKFSRQHHARVHNQNSTHIVLSVFNNAMGTGKFEHPSGHNSRGLILALRTDTHPMTVETVALFDRPDGRYSSARGSVQLLDGGNVFIGWAKSSMCSEHTMDGKLVLQGKFMLKGANTYRAYKYPWVGRPSQPPDVHSAAVQVSPNQTNTLVHVSWNGDTEVKMWNLYKTSADGRQDLLVASTLRQGFESALSYPGYASYILVEGVDATGKVLGRSRIEETLPPANLMGASVAKEAQWLEDHSPGVNGGQTWISSTTSLLKNPLVMFLLGVVFCACGIIGLQSVTNAKRGAPSWWRTRRARSGDYESLQQKDPDENEFGDETLTEEEYQYVEKVQPER